MTLALPNKTRIATLLKEIEDKEEAIKDPNRDRIQEIKYLLNESNVKDNINTIQEQNKFSFNAFVDLEDSLKVLFKRVSEIREDIEVETLIKTSEIYNWSKIRQRFEEKKVFKTFPKFSWKRYKELVKKPPLELPNNKGEIVKIDPFVARKLLIALNQMLGDNMDLWIMNVGGEGSGKSLLGSQETLFLYYILSESGIIKYKYDVKNMIKGSLKDLLTFIIDTKFDSYFNISILDEAEDLDRMNFREEDNKKFKSAMRRCRKNKHIIILNTPQIGEIETSVTLARINMIFYCKMDYDPGTSLLRKGIAEMFIIPRTSKTYSKEYKRNISQQEIKACFAKQFEKKTDYYKSLPKEIIIKKIKFYDVWGFDEDCYDQFIKQENKNKQYEQGIRLTLNQMYLLFRFAPKLRDWYDKLLKENIETRSKSYETLRKLLRRIDRHFTQNAELLKRMENIYKYK